MFKDGINLEKVLYKRADNEVFPTISYFMNNNTQPDGFVDGDMNGEYLGLLQGKTNFKDLKYDEPHARFPQQPDRRKPRQILPVCFLLRQEES